MIAMHRYGRVPSLPDPQTAFWQAPQRLRGVRLPASVDLRPQMPAVEDQGQLGSCGPNAACGLIQFDEMAEGLPDESLPSRLFLYYTTRQLMGTIGSDSGVDNLSMMKALAGQGYCPESQWPYDVAAFTRQPSPGCFNAAAAHKVTEYQALGQNLTDMKTHLAAGRPWVLGFTVFASFERSSDGNIPMPRRGEQILGGHDILICGYDDAASRFIFRNSWGSQWGQQGYGTLPYAFVTNPQYAGDPGGIGGWTFLSIPGGQPAPTPPPPGPTPTPTPAPGPTSQSVVLSAADLSPAALARVRAVLGQGGTFSVQA